MPTLYVVEAGARVEKEYHRLLVTLNDEVLYRVPLARVTEVVLIGAAGVTTPALYALLKANVPVMMVSRRGQLMGRLLPASGRNLPRRQAQYRRNDDESFTMALARAIVAGKLRNQRVLALRILRRRPQADRAPLEDLYAAERAVPSVDGRGTLLGIEGSGALAYFRIYRQAFDAEWDFARRTRRPPRDPVNALLSLGYTLLGHALMAALEIVGLDPYLGFFHAEKYGRPALALDILEEFRAPLVDSLVMAMVNRRLLGPNDFIRSGNGVRLTDRGLRLFLREFGDRLDSAVRLPDIARPLSYRKVFELQARQLARLIEGESSSYRPFRAR